MEPRVANLEKFAEDCRKDLRSIDVRLARVETLVDGIVRNMATKAGLADVNGAVDGISRNMATKADLADVNGVVDGIARNMATKADLADVNGVVDGIARNMATKADIAEVKGIVSQTETRILKWFIGTAFALTGLAFATAKLLA